MVENVLRFVPSFNAAKKFVSQDRLGNLHYAEGTYLHDVKDIHRVVQETP
jgi:predicted dehydrogenase